MKGILLGAYVEGVKTRKDNTIVISIGTNELTPEKAGELFSMNGKYIFAHLSSTEISKDEQDEVESIELDLPGKSPSQRLRSVLYLLWKQNPEGFKDQNLYYLHFMDKILNHYKSKLTP